MAEGNEVNVYDIGARKKKKKSDPDRKVIARGLLTGRTSDDKQYMKVFAKDEYKAKYTKTRRVKSLLQLSWMD